MCLLVFDVFGWQRNLKAASGPYFLYVIYPKPNLLPEVKERERERVTGKVDVMRYMSTNY